MLQRLEELGAQAFEQIDAATKPADLEAVRIAYLGRKGALTGLLKGLGKLEMSARIETGQAANKLKKSIDEAIKVRQVVLLDAVSAVPEGFDVTRRVPDLGHHGVLASL